MKEQRNLHLKVQELCDCYATADPLKEMSVVGQDKDKEEAALKWLALAALHGVNQQRRADRDPPRQGRHAARQRRIPRDGAAVAGRRGGREDL